VRMYDKMPQEKQQKHQENAMLYLDELE